MEKAGEAEITTSDKDGLSRFESESLPSRIGHSTEGCLRGKDEVRPNGWTARGQQRAEKRPSI